MSKRAYAQVDEAQFELSSVRTGRVEFRQPVEIARFSFDANRAQTLDTAQLVGSVVGETGRLIVQRWYCEPELPADLNVGFPNLYRRSDPSQEGLIGPLLYAVQQSNATARQSFVTWRGLFTKIMCAISSPSDAWELNAGTIYIEERKERNGPQANERQARMTYWGYKFETLATLAKPRAECTPNELAERGSVPVDTNEQFCSIVQTRIGKHTVILGGEVDCVDESEPKGKGYVELKTSKLLRSQRDKSTFARWKLSKYWAQSFLLGVPRIIVGFRDDDGVVQEVRHYSTLKLPRLAREMHAASAPGSNDSERWGQRRPPPPPLWDANEMLSCLEAFLSFLHANIDRDGGMWRISKPAHAPVINVKPVTSIEDWGFLPGWFTALPKEGEDP